MYRYVPDTVRQTMQALTDGILPILGHGLVGVYLGGSIAMGDFRPASSNLDFLVVTRTELSPEDALGIAQVHRELRERFAAASRLEGDFAPLTLLSPEGTTQPVPGCEQGTFYARVGEIMLNAATLASYLRFGIAFHGLPPGKLLPAPSREQVMQAAYAMLDEGFESSDDSALCRARRALSAVRAHYSAQYGEPVSKTFAAQWGQKHLPKEWAEVIVAAQRTLQSGDAGIHGSVLVHPFPRPALA